MKNKIFLLVLILSVSSIAQKEMSRWKEKKDPYLQVNETLIEHKEESSSFYVTGPIEVYRFLISDQDGDNCPFYPSCSEFFVQSVQRTNILQGILMFGDRFTRDMNLFNRRTRYPYIRNKRLYDPPVLYTLDENLEYPPK